eukprot:3305182-Rhodomonas_salina.4
MIIAGSVVLTSLKRPMPWEELVTTNSNTLLRARAWRATLSRASRARNTGATAVRPSSPNPAEQSMRTCKIVAIHDCGSGSRGKSEGAAARLK